MKPPRPFPSPLQAALLTMMGSFFAGATALIAAQATTPTTALGIGTAVGFGAAGALGAASIPRPHGVRVGLRGLRLRHLLPLLLLLPTAFLASEVDNLVKLLVPAPDAQEIAQEALDKLPTDTGLSIFETVVVAIGIVPLVEEWFFRGVIQQGLIANTGVRMGIFLTSLLFAIGHGGPGISAQAWAALAAQTLVLGLVLGYARHATGTILASTFLHVGVNALGVLSLALPTLLVIPGYDAPGDHTPLLVLGPSAVAVALGLWLLARETPESVPPISVTREERKD